MEMQSTSFPGMRHSRLLAALFLVSLLPVVVVAQDQSDQNQSLVKAAREKPAHKSKAVITDDDMPSHPEPAAEASRTPSASGSTDKQDGSAPDKTKPDSKVPHQVTATQDLTVEQAQAQVDKLKEQEQSLIRQYDALQQKLNDTTDTLLRNVYSNMLSKRDQVLSNKRKEIDQAEKGLQMAQARQSQGETSDASK